MLVAGDLNVNLVAPYGNLPRDEITAEIVTADLEDMYTYFLP